MPEEPIDIVVQYLTTGHLYWSGGYPYAGMWVGDVFVFAGVEDSETTISAYRKADLLAWYRRAKARLKRNPDESIEDALQEVDWPKEYEEVGR